jgi:hypothetical protein
VGRARRWGCLYRRRRLDVDIFKPVMSRVLGGT